MPHKRVIGIYCIENKLNGKRYIGSAVSVYYRLNTHKNQLRKQAHFNAHLQAAWNQVGESGFKLFVVEEVALEKEELLARENFWIRYYKANEREFGYNKRIDASTSIGVRFSDEVKKKLSLAHMGHKRSVETNEKIRLSQHKPVSQFDKNGLFVSDYPSMKSATEALGLNTSCIGMCVKGLINTAGGFHWCLTKNKQHFTKPIDKRCKI